MVNGGVPLCMPSPLGIAPPSLATVVQDAEVTLKTLIAEQHLRNEDGIEEWPVTHQEALRRSQQQSSPSLKVGVVGKNGHPGLSHAFRRHHVGCWKPSRIWGAHLDRVLLVT